MTNPPTQYRERLWPGPLGWVLMAVAVVVAAATVSPLGAPAMLLAAVVVTAVALAGVLATSAVVQVAGGQLHAGDAHIGVQWLGRPQVLSRSEVHAELGPGSDARDFVLVRSWLPAAVAVPVLDPADPTPQWLISTRNPAKLTAAIESAQAAHSEQIG